jgi:hypothetical protein
MAEIAGVWRRSGFHEAGALTRIVNENRHVAEG